jgi:hypothetical protein
MVLPVKIRLTKRAVDSGDCPALMRLGWAIPSASLLGQVCSLDELRGLLEPIGASWLRNSQWRLDAALASLGSKSADRGWMPLRLVMSPK